MLDSSHLKRSSHTVMERSSARWVKKSDELEVVFRAWSPSSQAFSIIPFLLSYPGCHPATDGGVHFHFGAGKDAVIAAEQSAQANHTSKLKTEKQSCSRFLRFCCSADADIESPVCCPQELSGSSPKRRRAEEKDEGIGSPDILEEEKTEDLRREMIELRQQLEKERSVRMMLEDQVRTRHIKSTATNVELLTDTPAPCGRCVPWMPSCTQRS